MSRYTDLMQNLSRTPESDECYTPANQVECLLKYIPKDKIYYEATSGKSNSIIEGCRANGYDIRGSDGKDFFSCTSDDVYDGIITNPPYSQKDQFIEHCYKLGKPFALLLPVATLQGNKRGALFIEHGISVIAYVKRIDFTGGGAPAFGVAWFIHGFIPPNQIFWENNPPSRNKK